MELLDRYLLAVRKHLPWQRQDDIIAELRTNLESQLEEREAGLGRPLTRGESEDWLRELGPPIQMAARYRPQQYLIGPTFFPTYWYVLRMAIGWALAIYAVVTTVLIATQIVHARPVPSDMAQTIAETLAQALVRMPGILIWLAAWVTLVFAAIEFATARGMVKLPCIPGMHADWNPSELPPIEKQSGGGKKPRSYALAVAEVVFGIFFLTWLLLVPYHPYLLLGPAAPYLQSLPYRLAPIWWTFYWWIVALNLVQLGWRFIDLERGVWQEPRTLQNVVSSAMGLIPLAILLTARDRIYVLLKHPGVDLVGAGVTVEGINLWTYRALLVILAISGLSLLGEIVKASWHAYRSGAITGR
jgi:hypothetical protein